MKAQVSHRRRLLRAVTERFGRRWRLGLILGVVAAGAVSAFGGLRAAEGVSLSPGRALELVTGSAQKPPDQSTTVVSQPADQNAEASAGSAEPVGRVEVPDKADEPSSPQRCPDGMVLVEGDYCPAVAHLCVRYLDRKRDRCAEYSPKSRCYGNREPMSFCIDRFEYPNRYGAKPIVGATWEEAKGRCEFLGKHLCTESEWTLACEGPEHTPHPYGYTRDSSICNHDKPYIFPDDTAYRNPATRAQEIDRLDQSEPSGDRSKCVSHYGAYDMTGNVDEWVLNEQGTIGAPPYMSGLKGGYWGPVRNRCRPMTVNHNLWHSGYQIGFRCCADASKPELSEAKGGSQESR